MPTIVRPPDAVECMIALRHQNKTSHIRYYFFIKKPQFVLWVSLNKSALAATTTFQRIPISISRLCKHTNSCNIPPCAHTSQRYFSSSSVHCSHIYHTFIACIASTPSKQLLQLSDALSSPFQASVSIQAAAITREPLQCKQCIC